jgi:hypothetical protein
VGSKKFKRRWFELRRDGVTTQILFSYYKDNGGAIKGEIDLAVTTLGDSTDSDVAFTLNTVDRKGKERTYMLRAPTKTEKRNWFTVLEPYCKASDHGAVQMPLKGGDYDTKMAAWLGVSSAMRGSLKAAKYVQTWVELRVGNIPEIPSCITLLKKADTDRKPLHEIWLENTDVINDAGDEGARFSLASGKLEHSFECTDRDIKDGWLKEVVPLSKLKLMLEKNGARRSTSSLQSP